MSLKRDYRGKHTGPGGVACPCCNEYGCHPRKMKALSRRKKRRIEWEETKRIKRLSDLDE
ncbi:MAG: hypothetical protein ACXAC5_03680 [Promethearchaeota archaeon]